jgi:hypothetical protein
MIVGTRYQEQCIKQKVSGCPVQVRYYLYRYSNTGLPFRYLVPYFNKEAVPLEAAPGTCTR